MTSRFLKKLASSVFGVFEWENEGDIKNNNLTKVMHQGIDIGTVNLSFGMRFKGSINNLLSPKITKIKDENLNNLFNDIK